MCIDEDREKHTQLLYHINEWDCNTPDQHDICEAPGHFIQNNLTRHEHVSKVDK